MARYREKILPLTPTLIWLAFAFLVAFAPWNAGEKELSWREGYLVAQSQGIDLLPLPVVMAHGEAVPNAYPLLPMLAKLLQSFGCPDFVSTRLLSMLAVLGLTVLVFVVAARTREKTSAGACAAAVMISSLLMFDKAPNGYVYTLMTLLVFSGQLIWYYYAALRGDWSKAWLAGLITCAVGFTLMGSYH